MRELRTLEEGRYEAPLVNSVFSVFEVHVIRPVHIIGNERLIFCLLLLFTNGCMDGARRGHGEGFRWGQYQKECFG